MTEIEKLRFIKKRLGLTTDLLAEVLGVSSHLLRQLISPTTIQLKVEASKIDKLVEIAQQYMPFEKLRRTDNYHHWQKEAVNALVKDDLAKLATCQFEMRRINAT